ncbi:MAG: flagellar basal body protein [Rickettsiales bacterium]|nr:flagellar basal body protein [Rickettsiales bacterium]
MVNAINTSLSGLNAATKRVEVAANNIANQNSTKRRENGEVVDKTFTPQRVDLVSLTNAGVQAQVRDVENPTVQIFDPGSNELVEVPNVDPAEQLIELKMASYDYKANIKAIKVQDNIQQSLLDILS